MKKWFLWAVLIIAFFAANIVHAQDTASRYLCAGNDGKRFFSISDLSTKNKKLTCTAAPLEQSMVNLSFSANQLVDYNPSDVVREPDGIKAWWQVSLARPDRLDSGLKFDRFKTIEKFYCGKRLHQSGQTTFFFKGKVVDINRAALPPQETDPASLDDLIYKKVCPSTPEPPAPPRHAEDEDAPTQEELDDLRNDEWTPRGAE